MALLTDKDLKILLAIKAFLSFYKILWLEYCLSGHMIYVQHKTLNDMPSKVLSIHYKYILK